jgi:hypothetical protein
MYVDLHGRSDALGANLTFFMSQLILAKEHGLHIEILPELPSGSPPFPSRVEIKDSIFAKTLFNVIRIHNSGLPSKIGEKVNLDISDGLLLFSRCVLKTKMDMFSYFIKNFPWARSILDNHALSSGYTIPFNPEKTILVHLRLLDVKHNPHYDGRICAGYVADKLNNGQVFNWYEISRPYNYQASFPQENIQKVIDLAMEKNPGRKVILVTSPGEDMSSWPYESISSKDESYDMYLLCNAEVAVLSRSTFSLSALFFTEYKDVYVPLWGHIACMGLNTVYQQEIKGLNFFA